MEWNEQLKPLNDITRTAAISRCCEYAHYKVIVLMPMRKNAEEEIRLTVTEIQSNPHFIDKLQRATFSRALSSEIRFKNGSSMKFLSPVESARGNKCFELLYSTQIDISDYEPLIMCMVRPRDCLDSWTNESF